MQGCWCFSRRADYHSEVAFQQREPGFLRSGPQECVEGGQALSGCRATGALLAACKAALAPCAEPVCGVRTSTQVTSYQAHIPDSVCRVVHLRACAVDFMQPQVSSTLDAHQRHNILIKLCGDGAKWWLAMVCMPETRIYWCVGGCFMQSGGR